MKDARKIAGVAAVAVVIVVVWLAWPRHAAPPESGPAVASGSALGPPSIVRPLAGAPKAPAAGPDPAASGSDEPVEGPPMDRVSFNKRKAAMTKDALDSVNDWINYPLWSSRLTDNMQYKPPVPAHTEAKGPGGAYPWLELYPEKLNYAFGDTIRIIVVAHGENGNIEFDALTGATGDALRPRPKMDLTWVEQADKTYVATLDVPPDVARANRGDWGVNVDCEMDGQHRTGHTQFRIMATDATVTGPYRVALENGSLAVYVTINATAASRQHLKGELWSAHDDPIAYAWVRNDDTPVGNSEMKLVFYGKLMRDMGIDGPYRVKNLLLTTSDQNWDRLENPAVDPNLVTPPFKHTDFTDVPINGNDPTLTEKKQILEGELAKAQANGYDPNNPEPPPLTKADKNAPPPQ